MIDDLFPELPLDLTGPAPAFKPYRHRMEKTLVWLQNNWLPIAGIIIGIVIV